MRTKRYSWNRRKHRLLDFKMGLTQQMNKPFGELARACGMSDIMPGTKGLIPFFIFNRQTQPLNKTIPYDVTSKEAKRTFLMATILHSLS